MVAVLGERLDSMLWEVFSNLNNSMIKNGIPCWALSDPRVSLPQVRARPAPAPAAILPAQLPSHRSLPARPAPQRGLRCPRAPLSPWLGVPSPLRPVPLPQIALRQGMRADTGALLALCEKTDNDIRSCINTLQVLGTRGWPWKHGHGSGATGMALGTRQRGQNSLPGRSLKHPPCPLGCF